MLLWPSTTDTRSIGTPAWEEAPVRSVQGAARAVIQWLVVMDPEPKEYISLKSLAPKLGLDRSNARKYVLRLGIKPHRRRTPDSRGQLMLAVSMSEAERILKTRQEQGFLAS